jgi:RNA polymerase sigma-70 factor (ECF subfamily)
MNQLTLLRRVHENERPTDEALTAGRAALMTAIQGDSPAATPSRPVRRARRRIRMAGLTALGAGVLTATLVLTNVVGFAGWRGSAAPAAAGVLEQAARAAISTSDPIVGTGQYLEVSSTMISTAFGETEDHVQGDYQYRASSALYIPADESDNWVRVSQPGTLEATFGPISRAVAAKTFTTKRTKPEIVRAPNGEFYGSRNIFDSDGWPRDPYRLLNRIYLLTLGTGPSADGEALVFIADALRQGTVPADLRAAMFEAAAMIPGVTITEDEATLDGHTGVAIGRYEEGWNARQEIIIDPDTGLLIGEREVLLKAYDDSEIPVGTVLRWSTVSTRVVDEAP